MYSFSFSNAQNNHKWFEKMNRSDHSLMGQFSSYSSYNSANYQQNMSVTLPVDERSISRNSQCKRFVHDRINFTISLNWQMTVFLTRFHHSAHVLYNQKSILSKKPKQKQYDLLSLFKYNFLCCKFKSKNPQLYLLICNRKFENFEHTFQLFTTSFLTPTFFVLLLQTTS